MDANALFSHNIRLLNLSTKIFSDKCSRDFQRCNGYEILHKVSIFRLNVKNVLLLYRSFLNIHPKPTVQNMHSPVSVRYHIITIIKALLIGPRCERPTHSYEDQHCDCRFGFVKQFLSR